MVMEYEGYVAKIEYDEDDEVFHGRIVNIRDLVTFQGHSDAALRAALIDSVADYRAMCVEEGAAPQPPLSGRVVVRVDPSLHRDAVIAATRSGQTLNAFVREAIARHADRSA